MAENKKKSKRRIDRQKQRNRRVLLFIAGCAVLIPVAVRAGLGGYVKNADKGTIFEGIRVGSSNVSGMTKEEALETVREDLDESKKEQIHLKLGNGKTIDVSLEELGFSAANVEEAVSEAMRQGRSGRVFQDYRIVKKAKKKELNLTIPLTCEISEKQAEEVIKQRSEGLLHQPVNAAVTGGENVTLIEGQDGEVPDINKTVRTIHEFLNQDWNGKGGTLSLAVKYTSPEITEQDLEDVTDLLGSYSTYYDVGNTGRTQNVENGARKLNGILLKPGEKLSAGTQMGPCTAENGYTEAASYESNTVVQSMGGGICQVSTTLYNALLYAELEIVERYQHSMLVSYVTPSRDAAIADGLLDLVFKNNKETPVYIESAFSGGELTFYVYGKETRDPKREIVFESETIETEEVEGKRFVATDNAIGYWQVQSGSHPQITARLWKIIYEDGVEVSREAVNYSRYVASPETVGVGTASDNPEYTVKMTQAILSQDEDTIQRTIQEILYGVQENPQTDTRGNEPAEGTDSGTSGDTGTTENMDNSNSENTTAAEADDANPA